MADLFLVVDTGGSQTKIIYQQPHHKLPGFFLMPPEVEHISPQQLELYQERIGWLGSPAPQQQAWLTVNDEIWVVGAFAAEFDPQNRLHEKKYENALYKVLTAIGILAQKLSLPSPKLSVQLGILLPWQEFSDHKAFEAQLRSMLANFHFRKLKLKVKLEAFLCRPEGGGLAATRVRQKGLDWFQQQQLIVLLFGHRNTSALYFEQGQFKQGDSPLYGFSLMIDLILERFSLLDRHALLLALNAAMQQAERDQSRLSRPTWHKSLNYPDWHTDENIQSLVSTRNQALREAEFQSLGKAIDTALKLYWQKLKAWLDRVVPQQLDEVVISGGAAFILKPKLEAYFKGGSRRKSLRNKQVWNADLDETLEAVFKRAIVSKTGKARLADAYGLFDQLLLSAGVKQS